MATDPTAEWVLSQKKVFTNWVNLHLGKRGLEVKDLQNDFSDGVLLCNLMEVISGKKLPTKWRTDPKNRLLQVQNLNIALQFIAEEGIRLVGCGSEDICDGTLKLIMGLIWTLILRYQIQTGSFLENGAKKMGAKEMLMNWVQQFTSGYQDVPVKDFHQSWQDGRAFCALVHKLAPNHINMDSLSKTDKLSNLNLAFDTANKVLGVPKLLDANDIAGSARPDEQSIMTYVSLFPQLYSERGITADGSGTNEGQKVQGSDDAKKKEEEERRKKKEEEERKKKEDEEKERKRKEEEDKKKLMVKAKSHGEVNKVASLEEKLKQAEATIAKLTESSQKSNTQNKDLQQEVLEKSTSMERLNASYSAEIERLKSENSKNSKLSEDARKEEEERRAKLYATNGDLMKKEREENEERMRKAEEQWKKEKEEMEARWQKERQERDEREAKLRKEKEDEEERLRKEKEDGDAKWRQDKEDSDAKLRKEKEDSDAKWRKDKEDSDAKSQQEKLDAEERARKAKEDAEKAQRDLEERLRKEEEAREKENQARLKELEDKLRQKEEEANARKANEERLKKEEEENQERIKRLEEENANKGLQGGENENRIKELLQKLAETEGKLKQEIDEVSKWKSENDGTNKKLQNSENENNEKDKVNAQQKEALGDLEKRLEEAERRLRDSKDKEGKDDEDRKKHDEERKKQDEERRKQDEENAEKLKRLEKENADLLKAMKEKEEKENAERKRKDEEFEAKLKQLEKDNEDKLKALAEAKEKAEKEAEERQKREKENEEKLKEMQDKLNALERSRADAVEGGDEIRKRLEEENKERDRKLAELADLVKKLEEDKNRLEQKEAENNEKIKALEGANGDKEKRLKELEEKNKELEDKNTRAEEENKETSKRIKQLEDENKEKAKRIEELEAELNRERDQRGNDTDSRIRELEELLRKEREEHAKTRQTVAQLDGRVKELEELLAKEKDNNEKNKQELDRLGALAKETQDKLKEEEEKRKKEEEKRKEEEEKRKEEEQKRKEEEEKRKEEEQKRKEEEEKRKEEEAKRKIAEEANEANEKKLKDANVENDLLKKELERLRASLDGDNAQGALLIQQLEKQLNDKSKEYESEKDKREKAEKEKEAAENESKNKLQDLEARLAQALKDKEMANHKLNESLDSLQKEKSEREKSERERDEQKQKKEKAEHDLKEENEKKEKAENELNEEKIKKEKLEKELDEEKTKKDKLEKELEEQKIKKEKLEKELEDLRKSLSDKMKSGEGDSNKIKELTDRIAELENTLKGSDSGFAKELDNKNARIKELENKLKEKERESAALADTQANDLRRALEQVQGFHDILSKQADSVASTKSELHHIEQELLYSNQSNAELVHEVKQLSKTIAALKAKFLHNISNLPISEYPQFSSGLFAAHSKVTVNFSLSKSHLTLSSGACQFFDENAKPITKHQEYAKFVSKSELQIDFHSVPDDVACVLVVLTLEGGVLMGNESVRSEIFVDFKKSEHGDKIDLNTALDKRASIDKFENSANVPKRLIAIMFSKCEYDENTLWGTVKRFNISEGVWRVGSVGIFDCEKQNQNFAQLHKLVPIKRYGWIAYSDIQDIYSVIGHTDAMMTGKTHEISRLNQEVATFENTRKDLEKKLQEALKNQCTHGDNKITNEVLIKYKFYMSSQLPFFALFLLDMVTQQAVAAWARQLGDPARADPTRSPRTARRDEDALRMNAQAELAQVSETESTFKCLTTASTSASDSVNDERERLGAQIGKLTSSLESLVAQIERDKALARAMKSSVQLQQFLAGEAETVANEAEKGNGQTESGNVGSGMGTTRKGMKKMMVQSPEELAALLEEFKQMDYIEDEDSIPQDTKPNSTIMVVHSIHQAAQQALFSGKLSKSIHNIVPDLDKAASQSATSSPTSGSIPADLAHQIKREADRRNADMQGWVGEWVANLGKLTHLVSARSPAAGSASYVQLQKEFEILKQQHQEIKDKLDFLGNEQKATEEEDEGPIPIEKAIPVISLDIEEPMVIKNKPETPPPKTIKKTTKSNTLSPSPSRKNPLSRTPPPTKVTSPTPTSPNHAKTLPMKSPSSKLTAYVKEKKAAGATPPKTSAPPSPAKPPSKPPPPPMKPLNTSLEVDKHLSDILAKLQITGPISKVGDCQYMIGSKKVTMQIISGYLVIRVGGGFMKFEEWILKFGRKEGFMIAGEPISGTGVSVLGAHGSVTTKAMK